MSPECFLDDRTHYKKVLQLHKRKPEASMLPQTNLSSFQKLAVENSVIALHWCLLPQTTACFALSLSEHNANPTPKFSYPRLLTSYHAPELLYNYDIAKPARLTRPTVRGGRAAAVEAEGSWSRLLVAVRAAAA